MYVVSPAEGPEPESTGAESVVSAAASATQRDASVQPQISRKIRA